MDETVLPWALFAVYAASILAVTFWRRRRATTMQLFAIGARDVPPVLVGLSLAANMTSVATFVINPGLIYAFGWAGVVGYGFAAPLGIFIGLTATSLRFRRLGERFTALTVPHWLGERYGDRRVTVFFAFVALLQVTFLVLIVAGLALVLMSVLRLPMAAALAIVVGFTFGYILLGGAGVHVRVNALQSVIMIVVAVMLVGSGAPLFAGGLEGFFARLGEISPHYGRITNPESLLFRDLFEVVAANLVIGLAIIMQPHIISKSLYLRSERDVKLYLVTAVVVGTLFTAVLMVGLYGRLLLPGPLLAPDRVVPTYIAGLFSPAPRSLIMLGVLAAGFSTLEGVALALSSIFAHDLVANLARSRGVPEERLRALELPVGRWFLVALAPVAFGLAWWQIVAPSLSVAIFAQNGVYGLFAATFAPVLFGLLSPRVGKRPAVAAAAVALLVHFGMYYGEISPYHNNPAVPAACAIVASVLVMFIGGQLSGRARPERTRPQATGRSEKARRVV
jgi:SSS family solute:Na+ symporter/sodium/pantothenate symporter